MTQCQPDMPMQYLMQGIEEIIISSVKNVMYIGEIFDCIFVYSLKRHIYVYLYM
jgi:hypothetical protein